MTGSKSVDIAAIKGELNCWMEALPTSYSNEGLFFPAERRLAMCDSLLKGELTHKNVDAVFEKEFVCVTSVSVASGLSIADSTTICKIEASDVVHGLGQPKKEEKIGMSRVEVRLRDQKQGFVTLVGNQCAKYRQPSLPFTKYIRNLNKLFEETTTKVSKLGPFLKPKAMELSKCGTRHLQEAKQELTKLRPNAVAG